MARRASRLDPLLTFGSKNVRRGSGLSLQRNGGDFPVPISPRSGDQTFVHRSIGGALVQPDATESIVSPAHQELSCAGLNCNRTYSPSPRSRAQPLTYQIFCRRTSKWASAELAGHRWRRLPRGGGPLVLGSPRRTKCDLEIFGGATHRRPRAAPAQQ